jgi:hypothetical protein
VKVDGFYRSFLSLAFLVRFGLACGSAEVASELVMRMDAHKGSAKGGRGRLDAAIAQMQSKDEVVFPERISARGDSGFKPEACQDYLNLALVFFLDSVARTGLLPADVGSK